MNESSQTVTFTTRGRVVIPACLRQKLDIQPGTQMVVEQTSEGILIRPLPDQDWNTDEHPYRQAKQ